MSATAALDAILAEIQAAVTKGDRVSITGFGVFEKRARAARSARNPRTGAPIAVKKTSVPVFRPGATFKELVASGRTPRSVIPRAASAPSAGRTSEPTATRARRGSTRGQTTARRERSTRTVAAVQGVEGTSMARIRADLGAKGLRLTPDADRRFKAILASGATTLSGLTDVTRTRPTVKAQRDLNRLVNEVARATAKAGKSTVDATTIDLVLRWLCPLPPWC
jgi:DNA-binding protein HU-beta